MHTEQDGYGGVPGWCTHCQCRHPHHTFMCHKYHVKHTSKPFNPDCLKSGLERDPNETQPVRWLCTPHRRTFFGEEWRRVQPSILCVHYQGVCGLSVWGVNGVGWVNVEGSSVLSGYWGEAQRHVPDRQFIAKIEMAMRCRGVGGRELGEKCCGIERCWMGRNSGVRSSRNIVQVVTSMKTNRVGTTTHQS